MKFTYLIKIALLTPLLLFGMVSYGNTPQDSLGVIQKNGKNFIQHKVDKGNTIFSLSRRYNVKTSTISEANNQVSVLKLNSIILIPTATVIHTVKAGETLYSISRQYNVSVGQIAGKNKLKTNELSLGQKLIIDGGNVLQQPASTASPESKVLGSTQTTIKGTKASTKNHIVKSGETLYGISRNHGVSLEQIQRSNSIAYGKLSPGDTLKIPIKSKTEEIKEMDLVKSTSDKLNPTLCEIMSPVGKMGDIVKLQSETSVQIVYARIVAKAPDNKIYASKKLYNLLKLNTFTSRIKITCTK